MPSQSLKDKTIRGAGWSAIDSFVGQGIAFIVSIVLARLLTPSEYGLIGITTIFIVVLNAIVDSGFSQAVIRKKEVDNYDYNTMFITNMVLSVLLFILLYLLAPTISLFFKRPELVSLTRVMGLVLITNALSITQNTILTKKIDFKTKTKASLISSILSGIVGIGMAFMGYGVWALVGQHLTKQIANTVCLWLFNKWVPTFSFSILSFKYMWGFGWKLLVSGLIDNIWNQIYQVVVGKFYSPATLGQYSKSNEFASLFSSNLYSVVGRVSFPVLAEIQDDRERMIRAYRKIIRTTMFVTAICMISLGAIAEPLLYCLIGPQWHQAASFLPLICISMSLYPLHAINLNMLKVLGRSDIFLSLEILKKIVAVGPILLGIFVDIYWMLAGSIVTGLIAFSLNSFYSGKMIGYSMWMQIKDVAPSYGLAFLIALSVFFLKYLPLSYLLILLLQFFVGALVFFLLCNRLYQIEEYNVVKGMVSPLLNKLRIIKLFDYEK